MRMLFFMRSVNYDRHFEAVLWELGRRGHRVHVAFDFEKKGVLGSTELFDRITVTHPKISFGVVPKRRDQEWVWLAAKLRHSIDFLRYFDPQFKDAAALRERAEDRAPALLTRTLRLPGMRDDSAVRAIDTGLRRLEAGLPFGEDIDAFIREFDPDVVAVTPLVGLGSPQGDYIRAAHARGIPAALLVASWDNLTNKGTIRDIPDLTVVWNHDQVREAIELHRVPPDQVVATGAHTYDHWFDWEPSTSADEFRTKVGLDPGRPFLLYVCSSHFIAPHEATFIGEWLSGLRASERPELRDVGVLIRPHPANSAMWRSADPSDPGRTVVWPRYGATPTSLQAKADYYDSIYHCRAVVGINTSALIEAAIVGRPVFTLLAPAFKATQEGTLHFNYLTGEGGILSVAGSYDEHLDQLGAALANGWEGSQRGERFVRRFVRPHGLQRPGAPRVADELERLAAEPRSPGSARPTRRVGRRMIRPLARMEPKAAALARSLEIKVPRPPARSSTAVPEQLRILLVLDHPGILVHFDDTVRALAARGHDVHVGFTQPEKHAEVLALLDDVGPGVTVEQRVPQRRDGFRTVAGLVRALTDYSHYLNPRLRLAGYARRERATRLPVPSRLRPLLVSGSLPGWAFQLVIGALERLELAIPSDITIERFVDRVDPHLVVVSPLLDGGARQTDYIKAARRLGIPSGLCVASWDNLSSKGRIRMLPDRVTVWNDAQSREAVELHGVPADRVVVTGAQQFDRWFDRAPSRDRASFCSALGLPADRPFVLFVGSTRQKTPRETEQAFVSAWIRGLRSSPDARLRELPVLVRPHPRNLSAWRGVDLSGFKDVVVWNRERPLPYAPEDRAAYFDALHHSAAVVGINSSAMIEAAIVGRPVHTIRAPELFDLQRGLPHFHYLLPENGGFLREAATLDQHLALLGADLDEPSRNAEAAREFVASFVRPHGTREPATERLVTAIESAGRATPEPDPSAAPSTVALRSALTAAALQWRLFAGSGRRFVSTSARLSGGLAEASERIEVAGARAVARTSRALERAAKVAANASTRSHRWLKAHGEHPGKAAAIPARFERAPARSKPKPVKPPKPSNLATHEVAPVPRSKDERAKEKLEQDRREEAKAKRASKKPPTPVSGGDA